MESQEWDVAVYSVVKIALSGIDQGGRMKAFQPTTIHQLKVIVLADCLYAVKYGSL